MNLFNNDNEEVNDNGNDEIKMNNVDTHNHIVNKQTI